MDYRRPLPLLAQSCRLGLAIGTVVAVDALLAGLTPWVLLTSALAPTAYAFVAHPNSADDETRNVVLGHGLAVGCGAAMSLAWGLAHTTLAVTTEPITAEAGAAATAVGLTVFGLHLLRAHHAPAAATALLVGSTLVPLGRPTVGLLIALGLVAILGRVLSRLPPRVSDPP